MENPQIDMTILLPVFPSNSIIFGLTSLDLPLGRAFSSSQSSNYSNPVKYPGTCLVSSCLRLSHGKFEDVFDDFLQHFAKLLDVYHLVVSDDFLVFLYVFFEDSDTTSI